MNNVHLEFESLRCFLAVAEYKSFTAAGEKLHRTQAAISIKIQQLEQLLGQQLFIRTSRSVCTTSAGERLISYAHRLLALNDETINAMQTHEISGSLRIGVAEYLAPHRLPQILKELRGRYPGVKIEMSLALTRDLLAALDSGTLDVVVGQQSDVRNDGQTIFQEPLHWVQGKNYTPDSNAPIPLCLLPAPCSYRSAALKAFSKNKSQWQEIMSVTSINGIQLAVEASIGISVLGSSALTERMEIIPNDSIFGPLPQIEIAIFGITERNRALVMPLIDHLKTEVLPEIRVPQSHTHHYLAAAQSA